MQLKTANVNITLNPRRPSAEVVPHPNGITTSDSTDSASLALVFPSTKWGDASSSGGGLETFCRQTALTLLSAGNFIARLSPLPLQGLLPSPLTNFCSKQASSLSPKVPSLLLPPQLWPSAPQPHAFLHLPSLGQSSRPPRSISRLPHMRPSFPSCSGPVRAAPDGWPCWLWGEATGEGSNRRHQSKVPCCREVVSLPTPHLLQLPSLGHQDSQLGFGALAEAFYMDNLT